MNRVCSLSSPATSSRHPGASTSCFRAPPISLPASGRHSGSVPDMEFAEDVDYGALLERAYSSGKNNVEGVASPTGFEPVFWP